MSNYTKTQAKKLRKIINGYVENNAFSKNEACQIVAELLGKVANKKPYNYKYIMELANETKEIKPDTMGRYIDTYIENTEKVYKQDKPATPKPPRIRLELLPRSEEQKQRIETLTMPERLSVLDWGALAKIGGRGIVRAVAMAHTMPPHVRKRIEAIEEGRLKKRSLS